MKERVTKCDRCLKLLAYHWRENGKPFPTCPDGGGWFRPLPEAMAVVCYRPPPKPSRVAGALAELRALNRARREKIKTPPP